VAAIGSISVIGAIARRIAGTSGARRLRIDKGMDGRVIGLHVGDADTDPGHEGAVRQLGAELDALRDEVTGLRREMDETLNRLDFSERLLAQARERGLLNAPRERGPS
jgi:hypothetical protein